MTEPLGPLRVHGSAASALDLLEKSEPGRKLANTV